MFPLLRERTKVFKNGVFLLKFVQGDNKESRFCFSVSKKIAKNAVIRNKMRRAGYRLLVKYIPEIKTDILALFSFRAIPKDDTEIVKSLESILKESKLIK
jgi:ribonuclease P protein component